jgi:hypothetical protein
MVKQVPSHGESLLLRENPGAFFALSRVVRECGDHDLRAPRMSVALERTCVTIQQAATASSQHGAARLEE